MNIYIIVLKLLIETSGINGKQLTNDYQAITVIKYSL